MPLLPSDFDEAERAFSRPQRMVEPTLASSTYRWETVPEKPRFASRYAINFALVIAGIRTACVVLVKDVEIVVLLSATL